MSILTPGRVLRRALPAAAAVVALSAGAASAQSLRLHPRQLIAHTPAGAQPNAPAYDPAISGDGRINRYAAYSSAATDILPGTGPYRNVFLVTRKRPYSLHGTLWRQARTTLVSAGLGGQPANGDSWGPAFDGYDYAHAGREITVAPRCMAFVSSASNLVPGDVNGQADVFVKHFRGGRLTRIKAPAGPVSEVALDGRCFYVAYISGGTVYTKNIRGTGKGKGRVRRVSAPGGASSVELSANGKIATYARNNVVYANRDGHTHRIAEGAAPTADEWGRFVAFTRGADLWTANSQGAAHAKRVTTAIRRRDRRKAMIGAVPSMTAGGHFVFFVNGPLVDSNVYERFAACPVGDATAVAGSPHGNYAMYSCTSGALYMAYVGGR
jgi:hypothetical protein